MTYEDVKRIRNNPKMKDIDSKELSKMIDVAIEKQIPKKPKYVDTRFRHHGKQISDGLSLDKCYECPNCWTCIFHVWDSEKYCPKCGQALDWSDYK